MVVNYAKLAGTYEGVLLFLIDTRKINKESIKSFIRAIERDDEYTIHEGVTKNLLHNLKTELKRLEENENR